MMLCHNCEEEVLKEEYNKNAGYCDKCSNSEWMLDMKAGDVCQTPYKECEGCQ